MVHALELAHHMLKPGGLLIDLRPTDQVPIVKVHTAEQIIDVGLITKQDNFIKQTLAQQAMEQVIHDGLFVLERDRYFWNEYHGDTVQEVLDYVESGWNDATVAPDVLQRAEELMHSTANTTRAALHRYVYIARLSKP